MTSKNRKLIYVILLICPFLLNWVGGIMYILEFHPKNARLIWLILAFIPFVNFIAFVVLLLDALGVIRLNG